MTPAELRAARQAIGDAEGAPVTQKEIARRLQMGRHGWQSISKWEQDGSTVPGPVAVAIELMLEKEK